MAPILFVPGLLCSAEIFAAQISALWPHGPITVASTLEGETVGEVVPRILETAPPRFALVGISMGGYISLEIMRQAPERVCRLALLDTTARPDTPEQTAQRRLTLEEARTGDFLSTALAGLTALLHPERRGDISLRNINERMARSVGLEGFARQLELIISRPDSRPFLSAISIPTLVLVGDADALTPVERAQEIAENIPGAKLVIVPRCGHLSTIEQPQAVSSALVDWIGW
ncbi:MAG: alpha/beta fold hydrolase [Cupriavidus sp.]|jgi:pimeloyl-ACP methyl ester carboxylesterase|nr:MAG: alpha/beta fold hydrolase [Cupriavidus sp.]